MEWWAWIAVGAILLGSELTVVNAQFYLVFVGASALIVGVLDLSGVPFPLWAQWMTFTVIAAFSMVGFRRRIYEHMRRTLPVMGRGPVGETVLVPAVLAPGATCRLEFHGSTWTAFNTGSTAIGAGGHARIERVDGLTLVVHAEP